MGRATLQVRCVHGCVAQPPGARVYPLAGGGKKDLGPSIHVHAGLDKQLSIGAAYPKGDTAGGSTSNVVDITTGHGKSTLQRTLSKPKERRSFLGFSANRAGGASGSRTVVGEDSSENNNSLSRKQSV